MRQLNGTTTDRKGKHLRWEDRLKLQSLLKVRPRLTQKQIAEALECSRSTVKRELKRGETEHLTTLLEIIIVYSPDLAQLHCEQQYSAKGPDYKLGADYVLAKAIGDKILKENYSPDAVLMYFNQTQWPSETRICTKTLYTYIEEGIIPGVGNHQLLMQGKREKKTKGSGRRHQRVVTAKRSIADRPKEADTRSEFGHWEIDTVVGGTGTAPDVLLVLTERVSRYELIRKIPARDQNSVIAALDSIERQMGSVTFRKVFTTITADNGSEFLAAERVEGSSLTKKRRTRLYFAHPYSAFERGSNEQANGIIRRFIPKGSDLSLYSKKTVRAIQDWMNAYPRRILGGLCSETLFKEFLVA